MTTAHTTTRPRCLLLGTSAFAIPAGDVLRATASCALIGVITQPDEPSGRGRTLTPPPLAVWATEHAIPCYQPASKQELTALAQKLHPDIAITAAYGRIIPPEALALPRLGFLNVHPSLLPRWRGASPIAAAIAAGDSEIGTTIIQLDAGMDTGPIIAQERVPLPQTATRGVLEDTLAHRSAALLERVLPEYLAGSTIPQPQDNATATSCTILTRDDGRIDWHESAATIERKVRAYEGWPGTWTIFSPSASEGETKRGWPSKRLKILAALVGGKTRAPPGSITKDPNHRMAVSCGDGCLLVLLQIQPEGKPSMDSAAFLRGYRGPMHFALPSA